MVLFYHDDCSLGGHDERPSWDGHARPMFSGSKNAGIYYYTAGTFWFFRPKLWYPRPGRTYQRSWYGKYWCTRRQSCGVSRDSSQLAAALFTQRLALSTNARHILISSSLLSPMMKNFFRNWGKAMWCNITGFWPSFPFNFHRTYPHTGAYLGMRGKNRSPTENDLDDPFLTCIYFFLVRFFSNSRLARQALPWIGLNCVVVTISERMR